MENQLFRVGDQKRIELYDKVRSVKHFGKLIKPFKLEEIYYVLESQLHLETISLDEFDLYYQHKKFVEYKDDLKSWLDNLETLIKK